jgi:antitoxin PrlF
MFTSKVTTKGQVTLPKPIRDRMGLHAGDILAYELKPDGGVSVRKLRPFAHAWHQALSDTLAEEWNSPEDEEAFRDL